MEENKIIVRKFLSIPATGNRIEVTSSGIFRVKDGKVAESWDHFDTLGMLAQLDAEISPRRGRKLGAKGR